MDIDTEEIISNHKIMLNGGWIGITHKPIYIQQWLKVLRKEGGIPYEVSIVRDVKHREIKLYTDSGRCMRPLLILGSKNRIRLKKRDLEGPFTFESLRKRGVLEFVDVEEEENCLIAMDMNYLEKTNLEYTHM